MALPPAFFAWLQWAAVKVIRHGRGDKTLLSTQPRRVSPPPRSKLRPPPVNRPLRRRNGRRPGTVQSIVKDGPRDISAAIIHPSAQKSACYGRGARRVHMHVSRFLELARYMRVLVTVSPRIYREAVAFSLQSSRPDIEVRAASPKDAELELAGFRAHLLVHNDIDGLGSEAMGSVFCRVEVPYSDGMDARVRTGEPSPRCPTCRPKTYAERWT